MTHTKRPVAIIARREASRHVVSAARSFLLITHDSISPNRLPARVRLKIIGSRSDIRAVNWTEQEPRVLLYSTCNRPFRSFLFVDTCAATCVFRACNGCDKRACTESQARFHLPSKCSSGYLRSEGRNCARFDDLRR